MVLEYAIPAKETWSAHLDTDPYSLSVEVESLGESLSPNPNLTSKKAGNLPPLNLKKKLSSPALPFPSIGTILVSYQSSYPCRFSTIGQASSLSSDMRWGGSAATRSRSSCPRSLFVYSIWVCPFSLVSFVGIPDLCLKLPALLLIPFPWHLYPA